MIQGELPAGRGQYGVCYKPTLERPFIVLLSTQHPLQEFVLVHELVHYDWGGRWDRLSPAMQEGLADEVARSLVPAEASQTMLFMDMSALFNYAGADPCGDLDMRRGEYDALDLAGRNNSRGLGYFVAHRLGIDALRDLCDEAQRNGASRVSAEVLLTRAGLSFTDTQRWYRGSAAE